MGGKCLRGIQHRGQLREGNVMVACNRRHLSAYRDKLLVVIAQVALKHLHAWFLGFSSREIRDFVSVFYPLFLEFLLILLFG